MIVDNAHAARLFSRRIPVFLLVCILSLIWFPQAARAFDDNFHAVINGADLHFRVRGADRHNPYLVILHGGPGFSSHMFYDWGVSLESKINVVYLDQRWSGESKHVRLSNMAAPPSAEIKDYTIANLLKDVDGVREYLKVNRWTVLGHSWGGMLALEYAAAYPQRVTGLIFMDGLLSQPMCQDALLDSLETLYEKQRDSGGAASRDEANRFLDSITTLRQMSPSSYRLNSVLQMAMSHNADIYFANPKKAAVSQEMMQRIMKQYNVSISDLNCVEPMIALMINDNLATRDDRSLLARIDAPTLIINGAKDRVISPAIARTAKAGIKGSELLLLEDCGHFPFIEQPARTTTAVLGFVAAHQNRQLPAGG